MSWPGKRRPALASIVVVAHVAEWGAASHETFAAENGPKVSLTTATSGLFTSAMSLAIESGSEATIFVSQRLLMHVRSANLLSHANSYPLQRCARNTTCCSKLQFRFTPETSCQRIRISPQRKSRPEGNSGLWTPALSSTVRRDKLKRPRCSHALLDSTSLRRPVQSS